MWARDSGSTDDQNQRLLHSLEDWEATTMGTQVVEEIRVLLPTMSRELRSVAFFLAPGLLCAGAWEKGSDYASLEYEPDAEKPKSDSFASLDSVEGRLERLEILGYRSSDPAGPWQLGSRAATTLFQLEHDLGATGRVDEATATCLDNLAYANFYWDS